MSNPFVAARGLLVPALPCPPRRPPLPTDPASMMLYKCLMASISDFCNFLWSGLMIPSLLT